MRVEVMNFFEIFDGHFENGNMLSSEIVEDYIKKRRMSEKEIETVYALMEQCGIEIYLSEADVQEAFSKEEKDDTEKKTKAYEDQNESKSIEDSTKLYLKTIANIPLLSSNEEIELTKQIAQGNADARAKMIQSNLRLVVSCAKKYSAYTHISLMDLVQEGTFGLMKAVDKFDYTLGYKFSTYAMWWIRQAIVRYIADSGRTVRLPVHVYEFTSKIRKAEKMIEQRTGREATAEQIAFELNVPRARVEEIIEVSRSIVSLDSPVGDDGDNSTLADFIPDIKTNPVDVVSKRLMSEDIGKVLIKLEERERQVIILRFGLNNGDPLTLEDVGQIFGITRERIRQIEAKALRKLRHSNNLKYLQGYLAS